MKFIYDDGALVPVKEEPPVSGKPLLKRVTQNQWHAASLFVMSSLLLMYCLLDGGASLWLVKFWTLIQGPHVRDAFQLLNGAMPM